MSEAGYMYTLEQNCLMLYNSIFKQNTNAESDFVISVDLSRTPTLTLDTVLKICAYISVHKPHSCK
jgi:hypothetical protein